MIHRYLAVVIVLAGVTLTRCTAYDDPAPSVSAVPEADTVAVPDVDLNEIEPLETHVGEATFYADTFDRKRTASGEALNQEDMVAAHRYFPFGTIVRVTNLRNDRSVDVRIIDRGPFGAPRVAEEKVIDLSRAAAEELDIISEGRALVQVDVIELGDGALAQ